MRDSDLTLTNVLVRVRDLESALSFWTDVVGLRRVDSEADWELMEDRSTGQRIVLTTRRLGSDWALAFATSNFHDVLAALSRSGGRIVESASEASPLPFCLYRTAAGVPLLLYQT